MAACIAGFAGCSGDRDEVGVDVLQAVVCFPKKRLLRPVLAGQRRAARVRSDDSAVAIEKDGAIR
jgi:hypothetical protein